MSEFQDFGAGIIDDVLYVFASSSDRPSNEPISDSYGTRAASKRSQPSDPDLVSGTVRMVFPYVGYARFLGDHGRGVFHTSVGKFEPVPDHLDRYIASVSTDTGVGYLDRELPFPRVYSDTYWSDMIVQGSGVGFYAQEVYKSLVTETVDRYGVKDYCTGQPYDQLPGDWSIIKETGVGIHIDELMTFIRVNESCGVFCHYIDGLCRLAGQQLEIESDQFIESSGSIAGELFSARHEYTHMSEMLGNTSEFWAIHDNDSADVLRNGGAIREVEQNYFYGPLEVGLPRYNEYGGFLGQGKLCTITAPIYYSQSSDHVMHRLSQMYQGIGGEILIESANRVTIAKGCLGIVPIQRKHRDEGAHAELTGQEGTVSPWSDGIFTFHPFAPLFVDPFTGNEYGSGSHMSAEFAYSVDSEAMPYHVFDFHRDTYDISKPEATETSQRLTANNTQSLIDGDELTLPESRKYFIDMRLYSEKFHQLLSLIHLGSDGSITIREALGGEITLHKGCVEISGVSVRINGGKAVHITGGRTVMRSAQDVDIASARGRVRVAAYRDLMLLGGSSRSGGVLIESRGAGTKQEFPDEPNDIRVSGVVIKSAAAPVTVLSAGLYARTGVSGSDVQNGPIILDAAGGNANVIVRGQSIFDYSASQHYQLFGINPDRIRTGNFYGEQYNRFTGSLGTLQHVVVGGGIQAIGNIVTNSEVGKTIRPDLTTQAVNKLQTDINESAELARENLQTVVVETYEQDYSSPGNQEGAARISFGYPSSKEYHAGEVKFYEPHWQTLLSRISPGSLTAWQESGVTYQERVLNKPTYMWPGKEVMRDKEAWISPPENPVINDDATIKLFGEDVEAWKSARGSQHTPNTAVIKDKLSYIE